MGVCHKYKGLDYFCLAPFYQQFLVISLFQLTIVVLTFVIKYSLGATYDKMEGDIAESKAMQKVTVSGRLICDGSSKYGALVNLIEQITTR